MNFVLWMTGLPCSGKTTIGKLLQARVTRLALLDGDELREWLSPKDFTKGGRNEHNKKVAFLAKLLNRYDVPVCVSLISPYTQNRQDARRIIGKSSFIEVHIRCSLGTCEQRDVKGMYHKARKNEISNFTGISDAYEAPINPDLEVDSENLTPEESAEMILDFLSQRRLLQMPIRRKAMAHATDSA